MSKWTLIAFFIFVVSGCATENQALQAGNPNLTDANVEAIKVGMTKEKVLSVMGAPDEAIEPAEGGAEWVYRGSEGEWKRPGSFSKKTSQIRAKRLSVQMDSKGLVTGVAYDEMEEAESKPF